MMGTGGRAGGRGAGFLWFVIALALLVGHGWTFRFVIDDAFISFRYAANMLDGHGLVFNPGEQVEGYSNLLWVLLTSFGMKLGLPALLWARILGAGAMAGVLALAPGIVRILAPRATEFSATPGRVAQLLLAAAGAGACWMFSGLETPLFTLWTVLAWRLALGRNSLGVGIAWFLMATPFKQATDRFGSITIPDYLVSRFAGTAPSANTEFQGGSCHELRQDNRQLRIVVLLILDSLDCDPKGCRCG